MSEYGARLTIDYNRICPNDKSGMVDIECDGPSGFVYACLGNGHGAQCSSAADEEKVLAFGSAVAKLVREHFGLVKPLLDENPGRPRNKTPTETLEDV